MSKGCKVCDDRAMFVAVGEQLDRKEKFAFIARVITARGFPVSAITVSHHAKHRHEVYDYAAREAEGTLPFIAIGVSGIPVTKVEQHDIAKLIQQKMGDAISVMETHQLLDKDNQAAIGNAIKAQAVIDKRAAAQKKIGTGEALLAVLAALRAGVPLPQIGDGMVIDSTAVEVDAED